MTVLRLAAALLLVLLATPARAQDVDLPALLARIREATPGVSYLVKERLQAMTVTSVTEERDGKGRVTHTYERVRRISEQEGKRTSAVLRAVDDGKDVTALRRREAEERETKEGPEKKEDDKGMSFELPFTAENQPRHRFSVVGPDARDPRLLVVHFEPAGERDPAVMEGEALVDPTSGQVRRLRFRPSKYPSILIDRLDVEMDFRSHPQVGAVLTRMVVDGEGGLLFFKKRGRSTLSFSDVVFKPTGAPSGATMVHAAP
ncbi:hypothetical protein FGE12_24960 [Aggregicoccus sp. 17bor-14]|uniref:hypothetical protein n=1 Tax=Myxococcaceae TaxID=31 RepID=UPI00129C1BDA|nr:MULTISPECIES: hypothetical protein [Myxococcaceae]MBF5045681.1 hypothetical protein [Simulacricoccus sp. 17bor-14]MRI91418.1 hypothetical protein [Aggregicoccus sp. 17bor-14]